MGEETAEKLCWGFGCREEGFFAKVSVYQNTMTGIFFEAWFQQCLLPALTQKSVIILDNARFHRLGVLREMAEKWGHKVLPLAPYSPELNPIEKKNGYAHASHSFQVA